MVLVVWVPFACKEDKFLHERFRFYDCPLILRYVYVTDLHTEECSCRRSPLLSPEQTILAVWMITLCADLVVIPRAVILPPGLTLCPPPVAALAVISLEPSPALTLILVPTCNSKRSQEVEHSSLSHTSHDWLCSTFGSLSPTDWKKNNKKLQ